MSDTVLLRMIKDYMSQQGFAEDKYTINPRTIRVTSAAQEVELNQNSLVLVTENLNFPLITTKITLDSGDNVFVTSMQDYNNMKYEKHQFFRDYFNIKTENYGASWTNYQLHFLEIVPMPERNEK